MWQVCGKQVSRSGQSHRREEGVMNLKVKCIAIEECLTGRDNNKRWIYTFSPELVFGGMREEAMQGNFVISCHEKRIYSVGDWFTLVFK